MNDREPPPGGPFRRGPGPSGRDGGGGYGGPGGPGPGSGGGPGGVRGGGPGGSGYGPGGRDPRGGRGSGPGSPHDGFLRERDVRELRSGMRPEPPPGPTRPLRRGGPARPVPGDHMPPQNRPPGRDGGGRPGPGQPGRPAGMTAAERRRGVVKAGKMLVAGFSVLVLLGTGYAWATFQSLTSDLTTTPVIESQLTGRDGATDILMVGSDSRVDAQGDPLSEEVLRELRAGGNEGDLTDTLILVRIPNDGSKAVGISIPRDSFVEIDGGLGEHKINSAYGRAKNAARQRLAQEGGKDEATIERESVLAGRRALVRTIENLTGAGIDHYAEVNLLGFYEITKAIGGVEVCLNNATQDRDSGADFPAGVQTIEGADALAFVRQRKNLPRGDIDRIVRQQVFMSGVADKVLSAGTLANPGRLRDLINSLQRAIVLDDRLDPLRFAEQMRGIASGQVQFVTIPITDIDAQTSDGSSVAVDPAAVRAFVAEQIGPSGTAAAADKAAITVDALNGSGAAGLATRVLQEVAAAGFTAGQAGNADPQDSSVVRHAPDQQAQGELVAEALGGLDVEEDPSVQPGRVQVVLGSDYGGPGANGMGSRPLVDLDGRDATGSPPGPGAPAGAAGAPNGMGTFHGGAAGSPWRAQDQPITGAEVACVD